MYLLDIEANLQELEVIIIYDDEEQTNLNFINSLIKNKEI